MPSLRHNRRIAAIVIAALLFATTAYLAHGYGDSVHPHNNIKCDLCLQYSSTAGTPSAIAMVGQPVLAVWQPVLRLQPVIPFRRNVDSRLPRGPPSNDLI